MTTTRACLLVAVLTFAAGCGGKTTVKGTVTAGGKPVVWGSVQLVDASGAYHQGDIDLQGKYEIADVPTGPVKIGVTSPNPDNARGGRGGGRGEPKVGKASTDDPRAKFASNTPPRPTPPPGAWFPLPNPEATGDPLKSGLTGEVKSGQPLDIAIK